MKTVRVALLTFPGLRHTCYSAAMVSAIQDSTRVIEAFAQIREGMEDGNAEEPGTK